MKKIFLTLIVLTCAAASAQTELVTNTQPILTSNPKLVMVTAELQTRKEDACTVTMLKDASTHVTFDDTVHQGGLSAQPGETLTLVVECQEGRAAKQFKVPSNDISFRVGRSRGSLWDAYYGTVPNLVMRTANN